MADQVDPTPVRIMQTSIRIYRELGSGFSMREVDQLLLACSEPQLTATSARLPSI